MIPGFVFAGCNNLCCMLYGVSNTCVDCRLKIWIPKLKVRVPSLLLIPPPSLAAAWRRQGFKSTFVPSPSFGARKSHIRLAASASHFITRRRQFYTPGLALADFFADKLCEMSVRLHSRNLAVHCLRLIISRSSKSAIRGGRGWVINVLRLSVRVCSNIHI